MAMLAWHDACMLMSSLLTLVLYCRFTLLMYCLFALVLYCPLTLVLYCLCTLVLYCLCTLSSGHRHHAIHAHAGTTPWGRESPGAGPPWTFTCTCQCLSHTTLLDKS